MTRGERIKERAGRSWTRWQDMKKRPNVGLAEARRVWFWLVAWDFLLHRESAGCG